MHACIHTHMHAWHIYTHSHACTTHTHSHTHSLSLTQTHTYTTHISLSSSYCYNPDLTCQNPETLAWGGCAFAVCGYGCATWWLRTDLCGFHWPGPSPRCPVWGRGISPWAARWLWDQAPGQSWWTLSAEARHRRWTLIDTDSLMANVLHTRTDRHTHAHMNTHMHGDTQTQIQTHSSHAHTCNDACTYTQTPCTHTSHTHHTCPVWEMRWTCLFFHHFFPPASPLLPCLSFPTPHPFLIIEMLHKCLCSQDAHTRIFRVLHLFSEQTYSYLVTIILLFCSSASTKRLTHKAGWDFDCALRLGLKKHQHENIHAVPPAIQAAAFQLQEMCHHITMEL